MFDVLKTNRTTIRKFQFSDKKMLIDLLCNPLVTKNMVFPNEILNKKGITNLLEQTIASYNTENPLFSFAIDESASKNFVGICGFNQLDGKTLEVFYAIYPDLWGKGFATEVLAGLTNYTFKETNYEILIAPITRKNKASIKVAEKNDFQNCGLKKDPNYADLVFIYKREKNQNFKRA